MSDPITATEDAQEAAAAMPQGAARAQAEDELDALQPGPADQPHFAPQADPAQVIDEPIHDMLGRRDAP